MTLDQVNELLVALVGAYPHMAVQEHTAVIWHRTTFADVRADLAAEAVGEWIRTQSRPPAPADIVRTARAIGSRPPAFSRATLPPGPPTRDRSVEVRRIIAAVMASTRIPDDPRELT